MNRTIQLQQTLSALNKKNFQNFIIQEMGFTLNGKLDDEIRHKAYLEFRKRTCRTNFAAVTTMKRWFGISDCSKPTRAVMFHIGFVLKLDKKEMDRYFEEGLQEPSFVISDYHEMVFLYGIENHESYETCLNMIERIEQNLNSLYATRKTCNTNELLKQFEREKHVSPEEFILWMLDRIEWFKGYSHTAFHYLNQLKIQIIENARKEELKKLEQILSETPYEKWAAKQKKEKAYSKESIQRFLDKKDTNGVYYVSENMKQCILELIQIIFSEKYSNRKLLEELVQTYLDDSEKEVSSEIKKIISEKNLSYLFRAPEQAEKCIQARQAMARLEKMEEEEKCPDDIKKFLDSCGVPETETDKVKTAKYECENLQKQLNCAVLLPGRNELLPLIHMITLQNYYLSDWDISQNVDAKKEFVDFANAVLTTCNLEPINEKYEIDSLLLAGFTEAGIYSYADLLYLRKMTEEEDGII